MSIPASFEGVGRFLRENDGLIQEIRGAAAGAGDVLRLLAERVRANQEAAQGLVKDAGAFSFKVAGKQDTRDRQKRLLLRIEETNRRIEKYRDDPALAGLFQGDLSMYYLELGNTYLEEPVARMVSFSPEEADEIRGLLRGAVLDAQKRKDLAAVLEAAVRVSKAVLKVAVKLAA